MVENTAPERSRVPVSRAISIPRRCRTLIPDRPKPRGVRKGRLYLRATVYGSANGRRRRRRPTVFIPINVAVDGYTRVYGATAISAVKAANVRTTGPSVVTGETN